jgi:hypothetical protein
MPVCFPQQQYQSLLIDLGERIDGLSAAGSPFGRRNRRSGSPPLRTMDQEIACPERLCRAKRWGHVPVDLAQCSSLVVHGLSACNNDLVNGELAVAMISSICAVAKLFTSICQRGQHCFVILDVALPEFRFRVDPSGFPIFVSLRFEVVEDTNLPAFPEKQINDMGTNHSSSSGDQSASLMRRHKGDHSESSLVKSLVGVTE